MKNIKNNKIIPITKLLKLEKCQCGKEFDFPKYICIYTCQDCNKMDYEIFIKQSQQNSEKTNNSDEINDDKEHQNHNGNNNHYEK